MWGDLCELSQIPLICENNIRDFVFYHAILSAPAYIAHSNSPFTEIPPISVKMLLYILVLLILVVLAILVMRYSGTEVILGAGEQRPVLVFTAGGTSTALKQLKSALTTVQTHTPVYNPTKLGDYSNVPIVWTGAPNVGAFLRSHPGVCGGAILWFPNQMPTDTIPESTFVVQELGKQGSDTAWEPHSHHRYYISKNEAPKYIQEILSSIR